MSIEVQLFEALKSLVSNRVYPDIAPLGVTHPYITWQGVGGQTLRFIDNTAADKRNTRMQVNTWAVSRLQANLIARQVDDALCASTVFQATPLGEPVSDFDSETKTYSTMQDFSIYSTR